MKLFLVVLVANSDLKPSVFFNFIFKILDEIIEKNLSKLLKGKNKKQKTKKKKS